MKALITTTADLNENPLPRVRLVADSAIGRQRDPIWLDIDDPTEHFALLAPCYRIGRLGKNIDPDFALRYLDCVTVAALILPGDYADSPLDAPDVLFASNGALIMGEDLEVDQLRQQHWRLSSNGSSVITRGVEFAHDAISRLSRLMTFKTGDRIVDIEHSIKIKLESGEKINASLDDILMFQTKAI